MDNNYNEMPAGFTPVEDKNDITGWFQHRLPGNTVEGVALELVTIKEKEFLLVRLSDSCIVSDPTGTKDEYVNRTAEAGDVVAVKFTGGLESLREHVNGANLIWAQVGELTDIGNNRTFYPYKTGVKVVDLDENDMPF